MCPTVFAADRATQRPPRFAASSLYRRRRRRRRLYAAAGVVVTTAGLVGGVWWWRAVTADTLVLRDAATAVVRGEDSGTGVLTLRNALGSEVKVAHTAGGTFSADMTLHNHGRYDARIEAFPSTSYAFWGLDHVAVADPDGDFLADRFVPFTLRAGGSRTVRAVFRFADCGPLARFADGFHTITALPVTYRIFGVSRTVDVAFDAAAITSQTLAGGCAHPVTAAG